MLCRDAGSLGGIFLKPVIGLTTSIDDNASGRFSLLNYNYINSITMAGGIPVLIPIIEDKDDINRYADIVDGILFVGGDDISPLYFGENPISKINSISTRRDFIELELFKKAWEKDMPIFGICRGAQVMNVALGGTLYQDIDSQYEGVLGHYPKNISRDELYHSVKLREGSKLSRIFNTDEIKVNSFHHQAVKDLGKGLTISAESSEGIIEGIEAEDKRFVVGVQWHPEGLTLRYPEFQKLFCAFVNSCKLSK